MVWFSAASTHEGAIAQGIGKLVPVAGSNSTNTPGSPILKTFVKGSDVQSNFKSDKQQVAKASPKAIPLNQHSRQRL